MSIQRKFLSLFAGCAFLMAALWGQSDTGKKLTAREMFYAAVDVPAAPAKPAEAKVHRPAAKPKPVTVAKTARPTEPSTGVATREPDLDGGRLIQASYPANKNRPPLGLRYTILKKVDDQMLQVTPDTVFHAGDRIQLSVEANDSGYLYIIQQGSSGTWKPMFPSAEIEEGNNRVERGHTYVMPPRSRFYFDEQAGVEWLFVVLSRQPEPDLEKMVYSLRDGGKSVPASEPAPEKPAKTLLMAANMTPIGDDLVGRLRNVYSRDLVIEKVDENTPGEKKEKAVYVVNPTGSTDSRVVADIKLTHQ